MRVETLVIKTMTKIKSVDYFLIFHHMTVSKVCFFDSSSISADTNRWCFDQQTGQEENRKQLNCFFIFDPAV